MGVDIHSHLIPGIDDGLPDASSSVRIIKELRGLGLEKFICTPHIYDEIHPNTPKTILSALSVLQKELDHEGLSVPVSASAEYMLGSGFRDKLNAGDIIPFPNKYLLIEMPYNTEPMQLEAMIFDIELKGYLPILAHPERYSFYYDHPERYDKLKELGCLFQLNLLSPTGYYSPKAKQISVKLLKSKAYDLIGTDLHHDRHLFRIREFVKSGQAAELLSAYPFKNHDLFL
ncbi:Tyrosine-protein phosphatase YwqE [bacterium A37T11]|nr:Tyrosine-protein phosphatase YwqE [bacterium A37T11]